jgi:uncharacterized protein YqiB (DUF1249 family)
MVIEEAALPETIQLHYANYHKLSLPRVVQHCRLYHDADVSQIIQRQMVG